MTGKVLTFFLFDRLFGIDITLVKEINRNVEYTPVPSSSLHIIGLINMRGQVVTLFDIAMLMGYEEKNREQRVACIILKAQPDDPSQVGFSIDKFGDVVDVEEDQCEPPPANMGIISGEFVRSVVKLENNILIVIEPEKVFRD